MGYIRDIAGSDESTTAVVEAAETTKDPEQKPRGMRPIFGDVETLLDVFGLE